CARDRWAAIGLIYFDFW
nr:immunoglobulin heavy chain junction region [Macaca mulatta]